MGVYKIAVIIINALMLLMLIGCDCFSKDGGDKFICRGLMIPSVMTLVYMILE